MHKVAGHLAREGATLAAVKEGAERAARGVRSLGISFSTGTLPGQPTEVRLGPDEVELGLGIHGEPGAEKIAYRPIDELAATMAARLDRMLAGTSAPLAMLVNDLGGVPPIEMAVATRAILGATTREVSLVFGPERLMTSLDMKGLSISVLPLDDELARALLSDVAPRAWPRGRRVTRVAPLPLPARLTAAPHAPSADAPRRRVVEAVCATLVGLEAELNALDAKVGDGDTGSTFATAARAILADLDALPFAEPAELCAAIASRLSTVMGGSSGILLSIGAAATEPRSPAARSPSPSPRAGPRRCARASAASSSTAARARRPHPARRAHPRSERARGRREPHRRRRRSQARRRSDRDHEERPRRPIELRARGRPARRPRSRRGGLRGDLRGARAAVTPCL